MREFLIKKRKEQKLTQVDIAKKLGISRTTLYRYEIGKNQLNFEKINEYFKILGYSLQALQDDGVVNI